MSIDTTFLKRRLDTLERALEGLERWFLYRDNRNRTAHDYGKNFAEATLRLLPGFVVDARALADAVEGGVVEQTGDD